MIFLKKQQKKMQNYGIINTLGSVSYNISEWLSEMKGKCGFGGHLQDFALNLPCFHDSGSMRKTKNRSFLFMSLILLRVYL